MHFTETVTKILRRKRELFNQIQRSVDFENNFSQNWRILNQVKIISDYIIIVFYRLFRKYNPIYHIFRVTFSQNPLEKARDQSCNLLPHGPSSQEICLRSKA